MDTLNRDKLLSDLETCINNLSDDLWTETEITNIHRMKLHTTIGVLRRCCVETEGLDNIWTDTMTDYEKASIMKERGFTLTQVGDGIMINFLGYHLWDLTKEEITDLLSN